MNRLAKWIMRLYPAAWRARYGDEVDALLADSGSDARVVADLLQGGIRMRISMSSFSKLAPTLALAGAVVGFGASFLVTPLYKSVATMQMTPARINPSDAQVNLNETLMQMETVVLSRTSLSTMITDPRLEIYSDERKTVPMQDITEKMKRSIGVRFVRLPGRLGKQAIAFDISFTYPDRFKAQQTVWALMNRFDEQNQAMQSTHGQQLSPIDERRAGEVLDVLDTASFPERPVFPYRPGFAEAGLLAGLLAAALVTVIRRLRPTPSMSLLTPNT